MDINKILSADFLDILFEGRNKEYGAYELRKSYNERIKYALIGTVVICGLLLLGTFIANTASKKKSDIVVADVVLDNVAKEEKKPELPPPPPPPKQEPPKVEVAKFTPPKIVKDEEVKKEDELKEVKELDKVKTSTFNQEGEKDNGVVAPPVETGTGKVDAPKEENWDQTFTSVQIEAAFPGGQPAWQKYLERNLDRDVIANKDGPAGNYTVKVTFIVDKNGNVSDVVGVLEGGGEDYGAIDEAVRVIKKGPKWAPGVQNGHQVKAYRSQRITFQVQDQ